VAEESNVDEAITTAKYLIVCYEGMIAGLTNGKPYTPGQQAALDITEVQKQKLFDALDQVAAELVTIDEYSDEDDVDATSTYVGHGVMTKQELVESIGVDYLSLLANETTVPKSGYEWNLMNWAYEPSAVWMETTYGTPVAPTHFIPMTTSPVEQSIYDELNINLVPFPVPASTATITTHADVFHGLNPSDILDVDGKTYVIKSMITDGLNSATIELEELNGQFTKATKVANELANKLVYKQPEPWYVKYNKPKGKK